MNKLITKVTVLAAVAWSMVAQIGTAHAGYWYIEYHYNRSGGYTGLYGANYCNNPASGVMAFWDDMAPIGAEAVGCTYPFWVQNPPNTYQDASAHCSLTARSVCTWQPNGTLQSDPVPPFITLRHFGYSEVVGFPVDSASGSNPLAEGQPETLVLPFHGSTRWLREGSRLETKATNNQPEITFGAFTFTAQGTTGASSHQHVEAMSSYGAEVVGNATWAVDTGILNTLPIPVPPRLIAPQDQRAAPAAPTTVTVASGGQLTCTVEEGVDKDRWRMPDGSTGLQNDVVTYAWSATDANGASVGRFADAGRASTTWTAPAAQGTVTLQCAIDDQGANGADDPAVPPRSVAVEVRAVRSVVISSPTIEDSYRRTMDGTSPVNKYRNNQLPIPFSAPMIGEVGAGLLNERGGNGSMTVDSVAFWASVEQEWRGKAKLKANTPNFTQPQHYYWSVDGGTPFPGSFLSTPNTSPREGIAEIDEIIGLGGTAYALGVQQSNFTVEVTDSDAAVGQNTYTVNWHLPYEKLRDLPDGPRRKHLYWVSNNQLPDGGGVSATIDPQSFNYGAAIDDVLLVTSAVGLPTEQAADLFAAFKAVTNILQWGETTTQVSITDTTVLHNPYAFRATVRERPENIAGLDIPTRNDWLALMDGTPSDDLERFMSRYDCFAGRVRYHHQKRVLADKYDVHGFHSPNHTLVHDVKEYYAWETYYTLHETTPTPPTLGDSEIPSYGSA